MSKENKHALSGAEGLIPEMRFPEFANEAEWKLERLGNLANTTIGEFVIKTKQHPDSLYPVYNGGKSYTGFYDEYNNEENKIVISARGANAGFVNLVKQKYWAGNSCYSVGVLDPNRIDLDLLFYYVKHNQRRFTDNQQAANIPSVSKGDVEKFQICFPDNRQEQQKIASCLSSLDELLTANNDKLDALKDHKKGLLQNLFPQEGETVPKVRFSEFEGDGEWDIKTLNELGELVNGLTYSPKDVRNEGLLVLRSSNIQNGIIDFNDCVYVRRDIKGANPSRPKDILVCVRNGSKRLIGKNAIIPENIPLATHGAFMTVFRASNPDFVFQLFQSDAYNRQVKADLGATINSINGKNFIKYEFAVPSNPQEQQKIASCLSAVDELITAQQEKIAQLQQHKKGLMQGLFPKIEN